MLLNYHGTLADVFTLAHEMGHSIHSWYSNHTQPYRYSGYRIFVAEVASTCNEALLIHDLLDRTEDETERRYLINYFLDQFKSTMFRQTMFAEFERDTHAAVQRGETLTSEALCSAYYELNRRYFGEAMEQMKISPLSGSAFRIFTRHSTYISMRPDSQQRSRSAARSSRASRESSRITNGF